MMLNFPSYHSTCKKKEGKDQESIQSSTTPQKSMQTSNTILIKVYWFENCFQIKFQIYILEKCYCEKTVSHLKGYTTVVVC